MKRAIAWMANHGVAANLLLVLLLAAGLFSLPNIVQEVFPEFDLDAIQVQVLYPGASPEEIEEGIIQRIEERIESVEGIRRLTSTASEGVGVVIAELNTGHDKARALDEIKAEIDRIVSFPVDAEEPEVSEVSNRTRVIEIALYGHVSERSLKELANRVQDDLATMPQISLVQTDAVRAYEISIEVSLDALRAYGLRLDDIARAVRAASLDLPGGRVDTRDEEILVRIEGQNYTAKDFGEIIVRGTRSGAELRLDQVATIRDGFEDADLLSLYDGQPAAFVRVFRTADEQVLKIVDVVEHYLAEQLEPSLPRGIKVAIWANEADNLRSRIDLLTRNGLIGLMLVLVALSLFLDLRLAFWVAVGIGLSFVATFAVMPMLGVSINMLSLFGFILAIGIVVDDAIVIGENIYAQRERGTGPLEAAVNGAQRIAVPVTFAVLTTVVAFTPLLFVPGTIGKFLMNIPLIVITVLLFSLVESLFILPHHLSHLPEHAHARLPLWLGFFQRAQDYVQRRLQQFIDGPVTRSVTYAVHHYWVVIAGAVSLLLITGGVLAGRYIGFSFLPRIEGDQVIAQLEMPPGTPATRTRQVAEYLEQTGRAVAATFQADLPDDHPSLVRAVYLSVGRRPSMAGGPGIGAGPTFIESNIAEVTFRLLEPEDRKLSAVEFEQAWRQRAGEIPGARTLSFSSQVINLGAPVQVEISHPDNATLNTVVAGIEASLRRYTGVFDVRNDQIRGKREVQLELKPRARSLGVTLDDMARQVRAAFFGAEALRIQRGSEEVRVYVRLPEDERNTLGDIQAYRIMTPTGAAIPLSEVAQVTFGTAPATIRRLDGRRIVTITADVDQAVITGQEVNSELTNRILPAIQQRYPGVRYTFGGEQREQTDAIGGIVTGFLLAALVMYALLAIPFGSYVEPLIIMASVPMGFVGAAFAHLVMGLDLGLLSIFGIVGVSGVVVNDSLVLIDFINEEHRAGKPMAEAIVSAARTRFRPILLTSLTTFLGVFPLIIERSLQAQFLVPMAASIGFGVVFATAIIMVLVPALTMLQADVVAWRARRAPPSRTGLETVSGP
ncbi:MAG: efflux RND transporter permease subunit [Gemmatimonadetes bacterium]|nr:MAG: efflux RND transporter permease subunit [Gemmatimonadota bacterium]